MSHHSVKTLLENVAKSLSDKVQFGYGRRSEFNMIEDKRYPYIWALPLTASGRFRDNQSTNTKTWNVALVFLDQDKADANEKESEDILDEQDEVVNAYMQRLDEMYLSELDEMHVTGNLLEIRNDNYQPFYKDDSDIHTGWLVTFQLIVPDTFVCTPDTIDFYARNI